MVKSNAQLSIGRQRMDLKWSLKTTWYLKTRTEGNPYSLVIEAVAAVTFA